MRRSGWAVRTLAAVFVSLGLSWLLLARYDFTGLGDAFRDLDWGWCLLGLLLRLGVAFLQGARWKLLFPAYPLGLAVEGGLVLEGANALIPARGGELARAYYLKRMKAFGITENIAAAIVERVLDAVVLFFFAMVGVAYLGMGYDICRYVFAGAMVMCGVLFLLLWGGRRRVALAALWRSWTRSFDEGLAVRLVSMVDRVMAHTRSVHAGVLLTAILVSACITVGWGATLWCFLRAAQVVVSPLGAMLIFPLVALGVAIPVSVGYVGVFHGALMAALTMLEVSATQTAMPVVIVHLLLFGPVWLYCLLVVPLRMIVFPRE